MAANIITIKGYIRDGTLVVDLPDNVQDGEVEVRVMVEGELVENDLPPQDEPPLTDAEIDEFLRRKPGKTGAEIIALGHTGGWEHKGITDSVAWIKEQRRKRREKRGW